MKRRSTIPNPQSDLDKYVLNYRGFENYKFAAILRVEPEDSTTVQAPVSYEIIENVQQKSLLRSALPEIMTQMSEELYCAGWLISLDRVLPKSCPLVHDMAIVLGEIPTRYFPREWRMYPDEHDLKDNEN